MIIGNQGGFNLIYREIEKIEIFFTFGLILIPDLTNEKLDLKNPSDPQNLNTDDRFFKRMRNTILATICLNKLGK